MLIKKLNLLELCDDLKIGLDGEEVPELEYWKYVVEAKPKGEKDGLEKGDQELLLACDPMLDVSMVNGVNW